MKVLPEVRSPGCPADPYGLGRRLIAGFARGSLPESAEFGNLSVRRVEREAFGTTNKRVCIGVKFQNFQHCARVSWEPVGSPFYGTGMSGTHPNYQLDAWKEERTVFQGKSAHQMEYRRENVACERQGLDGTEMPVKKTSSRRCK